MIAKGGKPFQTSITKFVKRDCLNPRTGGGLISTPPPVRFFADSEKTAARSAAKFAITVQPTI